MSYLDCENIYKAVDRLNCINKLWCATVSKVVVLYIDIVARGEHFKEDSVYAIVLNIPNVHDSVEIVAAKNFSVKCLICDYIHPYKACSYKF